MLCPPSLTELCLSGIPYFSKEALLPHIRSLRTLELWGKDCLDVRRLAAMPALQSLRATTARNARTCSQHLVQLCLD